MIETNCATATGDLKAACSVGRILTRSSHSVLRVVFSVVMASSLSACRPSSSSEPPPGASANSVTTQGTAGRIRWTADVDTPESAYVDPVSGFIFVSQITGQPAERDGTGRIAKLNPDGTVVSTSWATGFNAPKGLRSFGGTLWVSDIDEVDGIDMASGRVLSHIKIEGAKFLNDVTCDADGAVYVSDTMGSRIYTIKDGKVSVFAEGDDLVGRPNGILIQDDRLVVGGSAKPDPANPNTRRPAPLMSFDLKSKHKTLITAEPVAEVDGLESDGNGGYIVSDPVAGNVLHVTRDGQSRLVMHVSGMPTDLAFLPAKNLLIQPNYAENKVTAYDLSEALK